MKPITTYIREAIADDPHGQPEVIASAVLTALPRDKAPYLLGLLTAHVKDVLRLDGNNARNDALTPHGGVTQSPKYQEYRDYWQEMLDSRINVGGELKRYGSCTRDDLELYVKEQNTLIDSIRNQIQHHEKIITLMDEYNVATPDQLPKQEVA